MAENETKVKVTARADGFDKVVAETNKLSETQKTIFNQQTQGASRASKALDDMQRTVRDLAKELTTLAKAQDGLSSTIAGLAPGIASYEKLLATMTGLNDQAASFNRSQQVTFSRSQASRLVMGPQAMAPNWLKQFAAGVRDSGSGGGGGGGGRRGGGGGGSGGGEKPDPARGSFTQGLLQGAGFGEYLERGPGMYRQAAGRYIGEKGRQIVGGAGNMLTSGIGGLNQMLSAIPLVGGWAAGSISNAAGYAGSALNFNKTRMENYGRLNSSRAGGRLSSIATGLGMDANELESLRGQLSTIGGYRATDSKGTNGIRDGQVRMALSAQYGYGVDVGTSGLFMRGERAGAFASGGSSTNQQNAITDAVRLGIDASEYLSVIAEDIAQFESTGIPVDPRSLGGIATAIQRMSGGSGMFSVRQAQGMMANEASIGRNGPQTAVDLQKLMAAGYTGGSAQEFLDAQKAVENGLNEDQTNDFLKRIAGMSGEGAAGSINFKYLANAGGMNLGANMSDRMFRGINGNLTPEEQAQNAANDNFRRTAKPYSEVEFQKAEELGGGLGRGAAIRNSQIGVGQKMIPIVQDLEETMTNSAKAMTNFAPIIKAITGEMDHFSAKLPDITNKIMTALEALTSTVVSTNESIKNSNHRAITGGSFIR